MVREGGREGGRAGGREGRVLSIVYLFLFSASTDLPYPLQCLWLRVRLGLVKSLGEAVAIASRGRDGKRNCEESAGERLQFLGEVPTLVEQVQEVCATLEQMEQHTAVLFLRETLKTGSKVCMA